MSTPRLSWVALLLALAANAAGAAGPNLGQPLTAAELAAWDISIQPDGTGLPPGGGTPAQGAKIYAQKCALCHGENGKGGASAALVGGAPLTNGIETPKTIANFWGYALTAYILSINKLIGENDTMNAETLPKVKMPNRDGFIIRFPDRI